MSRGRLIYGYILMVGAPVLGFLAVLNKGAGAAHSAAKAAVPAAGVSAAPALVPLTPALLILQIAVIVAFARTVGWLFKKINQPQVMGEMLAGIVLGPSLLGWFFPSVSKALFPVGSLGYLNAVSQVGLVLFMFLIGLSLNTEELKENGHAAILTSHASIAVPFFFGSLAALFLYPRLSEGNVTFVNFSVFMGAAMSITAFPVLARILADRNLLRTKMGSLAITCAAVDDVTGWCVLAYIVVMIRTSGSSTPLWVTIGGSLVYVLVMLLGVKRLAPRFEKSFQRHGRLTDGAVAAIILPILASALCTELLGIHLLFGAFLFGVVMPKSAEFRDYIKQRFEPLTITLLLPLFFAYTGLRTNISMITGHGMWVYSLIILGVAIAGKLGGCLAAGRLAGMGWRDAASVGVLMNTRGLMELIILNIGLDIGVISLTVFSMMVTMALVTTFMTTPLLDLVYRAPRALEVSADRVA